MALIVTAGDELVQHILINTRYCRREKAQLLPVPLHEFYRQNQIADSDGRCDGAGKGSDVDDAVVPVHALEGGYGFALVTEFTVIVILDDVSALLSPGPAKQLLTAPDGHDDAKSGKA